MKYENENKLTFFFFLFENSIYEFYIGNKNFDYKKNGIKLLAVFCLCH